jgi:hypothetical protein
MARFAVYIALAALHKSLCRFRKAKSFVEVDPLCAHYSGRVSISWDSWQISLWGDLLCLEQYKGLGSHANHAWHKTFEADDAQ